MQDIKQIDYLPEGGSSDRTGTIIWTGQIDAMTGGDHVPAYLLTTDGGERHVLAIEHPDDAQGEHPVSEWTGPARDAIEQDGSTPPSNIRSLIDLALTR